MKLWRFWVLALSLCLLCAGLVACGRGVDPENCEHPSFVEVSRVDATCTEGGHAEKKCEVCGFVEHIELAPKHNDAEAYFEEMDMTGYLCADCGAKSLRVASGKTLTLPPRGSTVAVMKKLN